MDAIIVSGMSAVGKTTVSRKVADRLGLKLVGGGDVLKEMALEESYKPGGEDWWDTEEGLRFAQERKRTSGFDIEVDKRLVQKAKNGDVVITSYPLPWLSKDGVKVWLSGSIETRAERMSRRDHDSKTHCKEILLVRDADNRKLYLKLYRIEFGKDLKPFDLVVDTNSIDEEKVASIIIHYLKNLRKR